VNKKQQTILLLAGVSIFSSYSLEAAYVVNEAGTYPANEKVVDIDGMKTDMSALSDEQKKQRSAMSRLNKKLGLQDKAINALIDTHKKAIPIPPRQTGKTGERGAQGIRGETGESFYAGNYNNLDIISAMAVNSAVANLVPPPGRNGISFGYGNWGGVHAAAAGAYFVDDSVIYKITVGVNRNEQTIGVGVGISYW